MDLTQLQGLLAQFQPTEEDKKRAQMQAIATAGFGLLGTRKGHELQGLSRAGLLGMTAREGYLNQAQNQRAQAMQNAGMAMRLQDAMRQQTEREQQQAADVRFNDTLANLPTGPTAGMPSLAPTQANAATMQQNASDPVAQLNAKAEAYEQAFRATKDPRFLKMAADARAEALKNRDENSGDAQVVMRDGKPVLLQRRKYGAPQELPYDPKPDIQMVGLGDRTEAVDKLRVQPGQTWQQGISPDTKYSGGITMRGQNMVDARSRDANTISQGTAAQGRIGELRKEFNALPQVKAYGEVQPVLQSAREAMGTDTAAADLNLIYAAAKIFDPTSVVRESETSMVIASGSPAQRFLGQFNYVAGGGRLTPTARKALMAEVESRGRGYESGYKSARKAYEGVAAKNNIPADQVFIEPYATTSAPPAAPAANAPPVGARAGGYRFKGGDPNKRENWEQ